MSRHGYETVGGSSDEHSSKCKSLTICIMIGLIIGGLWAGSLYFTAEKVKNGTLHRNVFNRGFHWALFLNIGTFALNALDKILAICTSGKKCVIRIPEVFLLLLTLLGGAPATALAMLLVCHKCSKIPYQRVFICMALVSILSLVAAYIAAYFLTKYHQSSPSTTFSPLNNTTSGTSFVTE